LLSIKSPRCGDLLKRNPAINRHLARDFYTQKSALCRRKVWRKNELYSNLSGKHFNYLDIQQDAIEIEDIANALEYLPLCRPPAGVLQRRTAQRFNQPLVPQEFALEALLHDAAEAYLQDIPAP
jgi:hypothetical protein